MCTSPGCSGRPEYGAAAEGSSKGRCLREMAAGPLSNGTVNVSIISGPRGVLTNVYGAKVLFTDFCGPKDVHCTWAYGPVPRGSTRHS